MPHYQLAGRVVVITGATGGLGSALAKKLRALGARIALLDLDLTAVTEQALSLGGEGVARGWRVDVRSYADIQIAMDEAAEHFGRVDVVIANAGIEHIAPMASTHPDEFDRVIDINLNGVWRTFRAALTHVQKEKGYLMAISSMAAFVHSPLQSHYTASKAGVWAMCDSIRLEVRHLGVGVCSVHPTFFRTAMLDQVHADPAGVKLWNGNKGGVWKMISLESVVDGIIRGIEQRSDIVVLPQAYTTIARAPGFFRRLIESIGFKTADVRRAIALASPASEGEKNSAR